MSNGATHAKVTTITAVPVGMLAMVSSGDNFGITAVSVAGCLFGLVCEPDLDQPGITQSEGRLLHHRFMWPVGVFWFAVWYPYARLIPHRSWASHLPVVGTAIRLIYLVSVLGFMGAILSPIFPNLIDSVIVLVSQVPTDYAIVFFVSLATADVMHWIWDGMPVQW